MFGNPALEAKNPLMRAASSGSSGRISSGSGPPSECRLGSHAATSSKGLARATRFQSTSTPIDGSALRRVPRPQAIGSEPWSMSTREKRRGCSGWSFGDREHAQDAQVLGPPGVASRAS